MAAALGVMAAASVVGVVAAFGRREIGSLAMLAAALVVVTGFVGAQRFSSDAFADGMALAWMMAALATLVDGLIRDRLRPMVPIVVSAASLILMVVMSRAERGVAIPEGSVLLALLVAAGTSGMLFVVPVLAERVRQAGGGQ
jgi:hypothetical protein